VEIISDLVFGQKRLCRRINSFDTRELNELGEGQVGKSDQRLEVWRIMQLAKRGCTKIWRWMGLDEVAVLRGSAY
jgi:hypothetical protein